jgi:hypothetical protein
MWFAVNVLFEGVHVGRPPQESLWEERLLLIEADSETEAQQQAETRGRADQHQYTSATGDLIDWQFRQVERVYAIEGIALESGTELFSRFLKPSEVESLLTSFHE